MTIYRGPGGTGSANSDADTTLYQDFLNQTQDARDAALAAQAAAELAETNAETAEAGVAADAASADASATAAAASASSAASSASAASASASSASSNASSAASSATSASSSASSASASSAAALISKTNAETAETNAIASASLANEWATKTSGPVAGGEYSSKYNAQQASSSASNASSSASSASTSASTATTQATNASNSAVSAATSATSASNSASNALTSKTDAANSATNAANSATSAASSASTATSQATSATTSATSAASSASSAASSATAASSSASAAATSATNAASSATAAQSAQSAAESARDAALSAYDNFDDRYLGPKSSDPTLDNDGNALLTGALYFNTSTNVMKVYDGSVWVAAYVSAAGVLLVANNLSDLGNTTTARTNLNVPTRTGGDASGTWNISITGNAGTVTNGLYSTGAYSNPTWLTSLAWSKLTSTPTTIAGYGITDAYTKTEVDTALALKAADNAVVKLTGNQTIAGVKTFSDNLGLGVTPSAWAFFTGNLELNNGNTFSGNAAQNSLTQNAYYGSGGWTYKTTAAASRYQQISGAHAWHTAASGTAGNAISFTQAMTLDASGNLGVGTTSPSGNGRLELNIPSGNNTNLTFYEGGASRWLIGSVTSSNAFRFYDLANGAERARIDSIGNLLVGTTGTAYGTGERLSVITSGGGSGTTGAGIRGLNAVLLGLWNSTVGSSTLIGFAAGSGGAGVGSITTNGTSTVAYNTSSDYRLKENVQPMTGALAKIAALKPVTYKWKVDGSDGQGFIAHELQEVVPDCVTGEKDAVETYTDEDGVEHTSPVYQGIDTSFLVATLTAAIQELKAINDAQAQTITAQQAALQALTARVEALEAAKV